MERFARWNQICRCASRRGFASGLGSMPRQLLARQGLGREASVLVDNPAEKSVANDGSARRK